MSKRINLHTHTYLCKHASGTVDDYCAEAVRQHVDVLGFSDHMPFPDGRWSRVRMDLVQIPEYLEAVTAASANYAGKLQILCGFECEYFADYRQYYTDELLGGLGLNYLIAGKHCLTWNGEENWFRSPITDEQLQSITDEYIAAIGSRIFLYLAHPDYFAQAYFGWSDTATSCVKAICQASKDCHIPLEINAYGFRKPMIEDNGVMRHKYPLERFWEIAAEEGGVEVVVGSDAHAPKDVWNNTDDAIKLADKYGLKVVNEDLLKRMPIHYFGIK